MGSFFALLLIGALLVIMAEAGKLIIACIVGITALILFTGGILLVFSIKPREYKNAAWMSGIAFFLLQDSMEDIRALKISFLNAIDILELTSIAFILIAILIAMFGENNVAKIYKYATLALFYTVLTILSH